MHGELEDAALAVGGVELALGVARQLGVALVDPAVDADLVAFGDDAALLVGIEEGSHRRDEERGLYIRILQNRKNARHALPVAVLALREPADRLAAFAQLVGLVIGVERQRHRAARTVLPASRPQRPAGAHAVHDPAPALLRVLPGREVAFHFHLVAFILRASSLMKLASCSTNFANSAGGMPTPSSPCASNCCFTSGSASALTTSAWMRTTRSGAAPAGSQTPNQLIRL